MTTHPDVISFVMLVITVGYMVYFLVKIKIDEKKDIALIDEEFLMDKRRSKK